MPAFQRWSYLVLSLKHLKSSGSVQASGRRMPVWTQHHDLHVMIKTLYNAIGQYWTVMEPWNHKKKIEESILSKLLCCFGLATCKIGACGVWEQCSFDEHSRSRESRDEGSIAVLGSTKTTKIEENWFRLWTPQSLTLSILSEGRSELLRVMKLVEDRHS